MWIEIFSMELKEEDYEFYFGQYLNLIYTKSFKIIKIV